MSSPRPNLLGDSTNLEISETPDGIIRTASPVADPFRLPVPQQKRAAAEVASESRLGSVTPSLGERLSITSGAETGAFGAAGEAFGEGFIGYLLGTPRQFKDPVELRAFEESARNYAENNFWKDFGARILGRTVSDVPIDLAVSLGTTGLGSFIVNAGRVSRASQKAVSGFEKTVQKLGEAMAKPDVDLSFLQSLEKNAVENLLAGGASEMALQAMGKYGEVSDIVSAAFGDALGGAALGSVFRTVGQASGLAKKTTEAIHETIGGSKKDIRAAVDENIRGLLPEKAEAGTGARQILPVDAMLRDRTVLEDSVEGDALLKSIQDLDVETAALRKVEDTRIAEADEFNELLELERMEEARILEEIRVEENVEAAGRIKAEQALRKKQGKIRAIEVAKERLQAKHDEYGRLRAKELGIDSETLAAKAEQRSVNEGKYIDAIVRHAADLDAETKAAIEIADELGQFANSPTFLENLQSRIDEAKKKQEFTQKVSEIDGRKLLGSADDMKALSKDSGIPVPELEALRQRAFQLMREDQARKGGKVEPNIEAMRERGEVPEGRVLEDKKVQDDLAGMQIRNAQELVDAFRHFGRALPNVKEYSLMLLEVFRARARIAGKSLEDYLAEKSLRYVDIEGKTHIQFNDADTIIKASRNADDLGDFFHEIGHVLEQDLTMKDRRILANLLFPKNKGKLRDTNLFGRAFSETFANHFITYLRQGVKSQRYNKEEKGLFNKIARWLKGVTGAIFGKKYDSGPMNPKVQEVFDRLFKSEQVIDIETGRSEFLGVKQKLGITELDATSSVQARNLLAKEQLISEGVEGPTRKQIADRAKEIKNQEFISVQGENAIEVKEGINKLVGQDGKPGEIEESTLAKSTVFKWARDTLPKIATTGIMTMRTMLQNMGDTGRKLYSDLRAGKTAEQKILSQNYDTYIAKAKANGFTREDAMKLKQLDRDANIQVRLGESEKVYNLGATELINLHLYARDGFNSNDTRSARVALQKGGYQLKDSDEIVKLTDEQLADIGSLEGLEKLAKSPEVVKAVKTFQDSLRAMGKRYHAWLVEKTGSADFNPETEYWMKKAIADSQDLESAEIKLPNGEIIKNIWTATDDELSRVLEDYASGKKGHISKGKLLATIADITPINRVRKGGGIMQYQNPFHAMTNYMHHQSRLMGMAEPLANLQVTLKNSKVKDQIQKHIGDDVYTAMDQITKNVVGVRDNRAPFGKNTWADRLYKGQVLSALSWNLSPIFKQMPAIMSSLSRIDLPPGTNRLAEATRLLKKSVGERTKLHEEMMERFPTYRIRYVDSGVSPDMSDVSLASHSDHVLFGDISLADGFKGGAKAGFTNFVEKGMTGIREADAATIRAVYLGVEDSLRKRGELDGKSPEEIDAMIEDVASEVIDETQGASHSLNRTVSQSSDNFFERQVAMFSSEATQQFNMILRDWNNWKQLPEGAEKDAAWKRLKTTGAMLTMSALGVAAAGSAAGKIKEEVFDLTLNSEEYQDKRDQYLENMGLEYARYKSQLADAFIGVIPYSGPMMGELLKAYLIGDSFEQDLLPFGLLNDLQDMGEAMHNDELALKHILKNTSNLLNIGLGVPGTVTQAATAASR